MRTYARRVRATADEGSEERLRQLLDAEQRLEQLVRTAAANASRRVAAAGAARDARLAAARQAAAEADAERARADRAAHDEALGAIETSTQTAIVALAPPDTRVDELARWALSETMRGCGELP